jgi:hypothetical protein
VEVEHVAKDLGALSTDERMAALLADAPELLALIEDLTASISEVRHRVGPLLQEVSEHGVWQLRRVRVQQFEAYLRPFHKQHMALC